MAVSCYEYCMPRGPRPLLALASLLLLSLDTSAAEPKKRKPNSGPTFGSPTPLPGALRGTVYRLPKNTGALPDFRHLRPVGVLYTTALDYPIKPYGDEWFAIDYQGAFYITKPGKYYFRLTSDDGSQLFIDGKQIINNDGIHGDQTEEGSLRLETGSHQLRVAYFQGPVPYISLVLEVEPPRGKLRVFDTGDFQAPSPAIAPDDRPTLKRKQQ